MSLLKSMFGLAGRNRERQPQAAPVAPTAETLRSRGNDALSSGDFVQAAEWYRQAAIADPHDALARLNLGFVLLELGDAPAAVTQLSESLALRQPSQDIAHDIHYFLARAFRAQGEVVNATENFKAAVRARPTFAEPMEELVQLLHEQAAHSEAFEWAQRLRAVQPGPGSDLLVAQQLHHLGQHREGLAMIDAALAREPRSPEAWTGRGNVLMAMDRIDEAIEAFDQALSLVGPVPDALANSAGALARANRGEEALQRLEHALQLEPGHRAALFSRANLLLRLVRVEEACQAARQGVAAHPDDADLHWDLAVACLLLGRFDEGWREHEWRWQAAASRARHPLAQKGVQWSGAEDLRGRTILLFAEQGFGDTFQMLRYVPLVAKRGAHVLLHLPAGLHRLRLVNELAPGVTLVEPGQALPPFDLFCPLMSLPLAFASDESTLPRDAPYLRTSPARVEHWRQRLRAAGRRLKVGVVWSGSATHANDANRSIALDAFRALDADGAFFVSLQQDVRESDRTAFAAWPQLHRWGEELIDFDDTAALLQALDLVICVDTSVAHLAGALAKPVWILLPYCPDWRWMIGRDDSPWYPSARLFRQHQHRDWSQVLAEVRAKLSLQVEQRFPIDDRDRTFAPRPSWPELLQRAQTELAEGKAEHAIATLDRADDQAGSHPLTLQLRGNALFTLGWHEEAIGAYEQALARKPDLAEAAANASAALNRLGRAERALERAEQALRLQPGHVISLSNRAIALQSLGRHAEAVAAAHDAHLKFPGDAELRWTYGATALLNGDFASGWPALDARWSLPGAGKRPRADDLGCPAWSGEQSIEGRTLLLLAEQGLGDTLQFVRYASELRSRGARVVLWIPEALQQLLQSSMPDCTVVPRTQGAPQADFHISLMDLPLALGTRLESIPAAVPYLRAQHERVEAWRGRFAADENLRVGLVWSGNAAHSNDRNRSLPLSQLLRIALPGIRFVSLQREVRDTDRSALADSGILDVADELHSFSDTAALVEALDLVISVDTSVAHLAGALGRPLWVLLPHRPDWRWLVDREDSPWYPTARLFRQPRPGDWDPVLEGVRVALAELAARPRAST